MVMRKYPVSFMIWKSESYNSWLYHASTSILLDVRLWLYYTSFDEVNSFISIKILLKGL